MNFYPTQTARVKGRTHTYCAGRPRQTPGLETDHCVVCFQPNIETGLLTRIPYMQDTQVIYRIAGNIGGNYIWWIGGFPVAPPILNSPILRQRLEKACRSYHNRQIYIRQLQFSSFFEQSAKYFSRQYIRLYGIHRQSTTWLEQLSRSRVWCVRILPEADCS